MNDSVPLFKTKKNKIKKEKLSSLEKQAELIGVEVVDDMNGMIIGIANTIHFREMVFIWLWFLMLHSELFIEQVFKKISASSIDENGNYTLKGTFLASFIMIIGVIAIDLIFR